MPNEMKYQYSQSKLNNILKLLNVICNQNYSVSAQFLCSWFSYFMILLYFHELSRKSAEGGTCVFLSILWPSRWPPRGARASPLAVCISERNLSLTKWAPALLWGRRALNFPNRLPVCFWLRGRCWVGTVRLASETWRVNSILRSAAMRHMAF